MRPRRRAEALRWRGWAGLGLCVALLAGCEAAAPVDAPSLRLAETGTGAQALDAQIAALTEALVGLGPGVDRGEAARMAGIAVRQPLVWAREWQVVDSPLRHNFKVIHGQRDKGVCRDWANALHAALRQGNFRTLKLHVGMANARNVKLEHVSVIVSARGMPMAEGLVLDPWRVGQGRLWYGKAAEDPRYTWETLESVRAWQAKMKARIKG
ncbi:MAG: hypothetical protein EP318_19115 [Rhodobacteraceae bacterium]|nr:MAG: hypothetical protein EP318_19115 [Paracoccaceae bacterium]